MKKILSFMAYALMMVALPLTSCGSDKDDDGPVKATGIEIVGGFDVDMQLTLDGDPVRLPYRFLPRNTTDKTLDYDVSNPAVCTVTLEKSTDASVDGVLVVTPKAEGTAFVRFYSKANGIEDDGFDVTVKATSTPDPEPEDEPSSVFSIKDADGHYHLLTAVKGKPVEYDAQGRFTNLCGMTRISEGRYRNGGTTLTLTFKSGTPLVTRLVSEKEYTGGRAVYTHTFTYDAQGRLTRAAWTEVSAPSDVVAYDLTWDEEKLLSANGRFCDEPSTFTFYYDGNQPAPLAGTLGYMPLGRIVCNPTVDDEVWAALCLTGCFGKSPTLQPTSVVIKNVFNAANYNSKLSFSFNADGTTKSESINPNPGVTGYYYYTYRDDK